MRKSHAISRNVVCGAVKPVTSKTMASVGSKVAKGMLQSRPIISSDVKDARKRVKALYKSCYRFIPYMLFQYDVPITQQEAQAKLKERFMENAHVTDVRVIDILIMKGQMELDEVKHHWMGETHVMKFYKDTQTEKPKDFLSKFYQGVE